MPFVRGFLGRWHPGAHPGQGLPPGIDEPEIQPPGEDGEDGEDDDLGFWGGHRPSRPGHGLPPSLPPRDEWPALPPWLDERPGQGLPLPIPPRPGAPTIPLPPDPEIDELPEIWPPLPGGPGFPGIPDLGGKTLALVTIHVSRRVHFVRWMVIDHAEAKSKVQRAVEWLKSRMPAGGIAGRPPQRPGGAPEVPGQHR